MENEDILDNIFKDLENKNLIRWPTSPNSKINRDKLVNCWSEYREIQDYIFYGYANRSAANIAYRKIFNNINKENRMAWKNYILNLYDYKYCYNCKSLLKLEKFHKNSTRKDGLVQECIDCKTSYSKQHYTNTIDKQKDRSKHYYQENKEKWKAKTANRRAAKLLRTPKWSNISAINKIYRCCPDGCHVDHVIPLQGNLVSGLHIPENLQYLPAKVNLSKGNKFEV